MDRATRLLLVLAAVLVLATPASAQTSASYKMEGSVLNAGGRPVDGIVARSASFRVTLDAIGGAVQSSGPASASFRLADGFPRLHRPPGEVRGLTALADKQTFRWDWEPASNAFDVYRERILVFPASFGTCQGDRVPTNEWADASVPVPGTGWFYLVTGENDLRQEGTLGLQGDGSERPNVFPCP